MRLWSIDPHYLDAAGLVALWREGLLAQKVLRGQTRGYRNHPQLTRFREVEHSIGNYLLYVHAESQKRGYNFDAAKILQCADTVSLPITGGQLDYEFGHLMRKLLVRSPEKVISRPSVIVPHPLFYEIEGEVSSWEIL